MTDKILEHIAECDRDIDNALIYCDSCSLDKYRAEHSALWRVLLDVDRAAAMEYRNSADVIERARRVHECLGHGSTPAYLNRAFDERIASNCKGFTTECMEAFKKSFIANQMDNYRAWYANHIAELGELMPEYGPELLQSYYYDAISDGETPERAFNSVVCIALERDF